MMPITIMEVPLVVFVSPHLSVLLSSVASHYALDRSPSKYTFKFQSLVPVNMNIFGNMVWI